MERLRQYIGILERLPCDLKQQALLRIHQLRLERRDVEEPGVEFPGAVERAHPLAIALARRLRVRIVVLADFPTGGRNLVDTVAAGADVLPEFAKVPRLGEFSRRADDGDGVGGWMAGFRRLSRSGSQNDSALELLKGLLEGAEGARRARDALARKRGYFRK